MREKHSSGMREKTRSSSPPATPVASSAGGSSPAPVAHVASIDWLGNNSNNNSKAGPQQQPRPSLSTNLNAGPNQPRPSHSTNHDAGPNKTRPALSTNLDAGPNQSRHSHSTNHDAGLNPTRPAFSTNHDAGLSQTRPALSTNLDAGPQESQPSCRPWERGDLLCRLATFKPATWLPKPKAISILAISRRGWVNTDAEKIGCESCGAHLTYPAPAPAGDSFLQNLDSGHLPDCPWRGNSCPDSLLQFSLTAQALLGGYKDRSDGLLQFVSLPVIATSALETIRVTRSAQLERFLAQPANFLTGEDPAQLDVSSSYAHSQKLISLCGWEPRWLPNIQDCEENSTQSNRPLTETNRRLTVHQKAKNKGKMPMKESRSTNTRSPLLDCSLCGSTVRIWDFNSVSRFTSTGNSNPGGKKLTRGASAASAINGIEGDGKSLSNADMDLNLTMAGGLPSNQYNFPFGSEQFNRAGMGRDLMIGQPTGSEVGDRAASYESRGPSSRKRNREEGGSTVDKPVHVDRVHQADSIEGTVIDRGDELDDETETGFTQDSGARNKRIRGGFDLFGSYRPPRAESSGAGPSRNFSFENRETSETRQLAGPAGRDSTRASSVIAMDTVCHGSDDDSMESVENYPTAGNDADVDVEMNMDVNVNLNNEGLDLNNNNSNQAQQSTCVQPGAVREVGGSSTNEGEELLNAETVTANDRLDNRDQVSLGISGGSVGMGASHEAEIHGTDITNDADPVAEVTENLGGHTGETIPGPAGLMDEDPHGDSQEPDTVSRSKADSGSKICGSKIYGSVKEGDSVGSGEKEEEEERGGGEPSLSCNAGIYSAFDAGKEEVTQMGANNDAEFDFDNGLVGATNGENDYETGMGEFDPIRHHKSYCPWVNGNVAAASCEAGQDDPSGSSSGSSNSNNHVSLCGWQLTLDALDSCQSLGQGQNQTRQSESAASLYKDDHVTPSHKLMSRQSASKSHGKR